VKIFWWKTRWRSALRRLLLREVQHRYPSNPDDSLAGLAGGVPELGAAVPIRCLDIAGSLAIYPYFGVLGYFVAASEPVQPHRATKAGIENAAQYWAALWHSTRDASGHTSDENGYQVAATGLCAGASAC